MFTCILFDIDGTLLDTRKASTLSAQRTLEDIAGSAPPLAEIDALFGVANHLIAQKYNVDPAQYTEIADRHYEILGEKYNRVYPFVVETLEKLAQKTLTLGIITAKSRWEYQHDFDRFELKKYFRIAVTASDADPKPSPAPVEKFIQATGVNRDEILFLGDTSADARCARAAGISFAFASWSGNAAITESDYLLDDIRDLLNLL
jgi:HAD superfamily hydrolase (TIGR01549 family)